MSTEQTVHVSQEPAVPAGKKKHDDKPTGPRRQCTFDTNERYTDEQTIRIAQNMALDLSREAFENLDFRSATAVQAMTGILDTIAKTSQANIKARQDREDSGNIAGAAAMVATLFKNVIGDASSGRRPLEAEPDTSIVAPDLNDGPVIELVPGEGFVGLEHVSNPETGEDQDETEHTDNSDE